MTRVPEEEQGHGNDTIPAPKKHLSYTLVKNPWVHGSSSGQLTFTGTIGEIQMLSMVMHNGHWLVGSVPVNRDM